jgi:hypothetical protein
MSLTCSFLGFSTPVSSAEAVQPSHPVRQDTKIFAASLLLGPAPVAPVASGAGRLLTVREVAERLGVCRATVHEERRVLSVR